MHMVMTVVWWVTMTNNPGEDLLLHRRTESSARAMNDMPERRLTGYGFETRADSGFFSVTWSLFN